MDIARTGILEKKRRRRTLLIIAGAVVVGLLFVAMRNIHPAPPPVERQTVWIDTVQRSSMLRQVRGSGTLVPVDLRFISAAVDGRVERIPALPGVTVQADTILVELSNPELEQNALEAEQQLKGAQADLENLKAQLGTTLLNQRSQVAQAESDAAQAKLQVEADEQLDKDKLIPALNLKLAQLKAAQTAQQAAIERDKFEKNGQAAKAQLAAQQAKVDQMRDLYSLRQRQVQSLKVRATIPGVLQDLPVQPGQRVTAGTTLAKVARPEKLKAQLKIPETQAKDLLVGQRAEIDTRNGKVDGTVARVAPSAQEGTVTVDVSLPDALPGGARPDLSVDGTITIEKLDNVLNVGRPAYGQAQSKIEMFKLVEGGKEAVRVPVRLGRSSVDKIEILEGLAPGDQVILSDTSAQDGFERIRLVG